MIMPRIRSRHASNISGQPGSSLVLFRGTVSQVAFVFNDGIFISVLFAPQLMDFDLWRFCLTRVERTKKCYILKKYATLGNKTQSINNLGLNIFVEFSRFLIWQGFLDEKIPSPNFSCSGTSLAYNILKLTFEFLTVVQSFYPVKGTV